MEPSLSERLPRLQVEMPFRVQGYDIDFARIVSNIVYVRWLEDLRLTFCDKHYPIEEMIAQDFVPVLSSTEIEYKRAIRFGDEVLGRIWFLEFRGPRWIFQFELMVNGETSAIATQTGVFIRLSTSRPIRVPKDLQERFQGGGPSSEPESV